MCTIKITYLLTFLLIPPLAYDAAGAAASVTTNRRTRCHVVCRHVWGRPLVPTLHCD